MRYRNWDVLLFPSGSKVPVQEFRTQCFVTRDEDAPFLRAVYLGPHEYQEPKRFNQLPILTSFIPSLEPGCPFQISMHSWEIPRPSIQFETNMGPEDTVLFEARLYIDGVFASGSLYGQRTGWPQIIDLSSHPDREGNQDSLRFPPFHSEILQQERWDAADQHGRVRVVLAEGFSRPNRSPPFERYRDILVFSFQHAPLHNLEVSGIAWPNPKMWLPVSGAPRYATATTPYGSGRQCDDHGHSPNKVGRMDPRSSVMSGIPSSQTNSIIANMSAGSSTYNAWAPHGRFPIPPPAAPWSNYSQEPKWDPQELYTVEAGLTPMVDDTAWRQRGARPSCEDVAMPDYSSMSSSSRPLSSLTGFSYEHSNHPSTACLDDDQYNELIQSLTPTKAPTMGAHAPSNTPSETMPPPKLSAAAMARAARYTQSRRALCLTDGSQPSTREVSGSSISMDSEKSHAIEIRKDLRKKPSKKLLKAIQKDHDAEVKKSAKVPTAHETETETPTDDKLETMTQAWESESKGATKDPAESTSKEVAGP